MTHRRHLLCAAPGRLCAPQPSCPSVQRQGDSALHSLAASLCSASATLRTTAMQLFCAGPAPRWRCARVRRRCVTCPYAAQPGHPSGPPERGSAWSHCRVTARPRSLAPMEPRMCATPPRRTPSRVTSRRPSAVDPIREDGAFPLSADLPPAATGFAVVFRQSVACAVRRSGGAAAPRHPRHPPSSRTGTRSAVTRQQTAWPPNRTSTRSPGTGPW